MYPVEMPRFGDAFKAMLREKLHVSQQKFAKIAGISPVTVNRACNIESGSDLQPEKYQEIVAATGMSIPDFDAWIESRAKLASPPTPQTQTPQNAPAPTSASDQPAPAPESLLLQIQQAAKNRNMAFEELPGLILHLRTVDIDRAKKAAKEHRDEERKRKRH